MMEPPPHARFRRRHRKLLALIELVCATPVPNFRWRPALHIANAADAAPMTQSQRMLPQDEKYHVTIDWGELAPTTGRLQTPMIPAKRPCDGPQPRDMEGGDRPRRTGAPPILLSGPRRKAPL